MKYYKFFYKVSDKEGKTKYRTSYSDMEPHEFTTEMNKVLCLGSGRRLKVLSTYRITKKDFKNNLNLHKQS